MVEEQENEDDFSVFIGIKDIMKYINAVEEQSKRYNRIIIKARGRLISRAVDIALMSISRFLKGWKIGEIKLLTEIISYRATGEELAERPKGDKEISTINIEIKKVGE